MNPQLNQALARSRQQDLRDAAARRRLAAESTVTGIDAIVIRTATASDRPALERLAELDSSESLAGEALIAERAGGAVAALSLAEGRVIADPFVATAQIVQLLRVRAQQLDPGRGSARALGRLALRRVRSA